MSKETEAAATLFWREFEKYKNDISSLFLYTIVLPFLFLLFFDFMKLFVVFRSGKRFAITFLYWLKKQLFVGWRETDWMNYANSYLF